CDAKRLAAGVLDESAGDRLARRKCDCMDHNVELAPFTLEQVERGVDLAIDGDVQRHGDLGADRLSQGLHALLHLVVDLSEGQLRALALHSLGDAPRDGTVSRNAYDKGAFTGKKSH